MSELKYRVIKDRAQYDAYCKSLEQLLSQTPSEDLEDEIELLTLLIEKYDQENNSFKEVDPITMLRHLMKEHHLKAKDLVEILGVSKGLVSDLLNYKKGISKELIRKLSAYFNLSQEAFNRPYPLKGQHEAARKSTTASSNKQRMEEAG